MPQKYAYVAPGDHRLRSQGFTGPSNQDDVQLLVHEEFELDPRDGWQWQGDDPPTFTPFPFPPPPDSALKTALKSLLGDDATKAKLEKKLVDILIELEKVTR